MNSRAIAWCLTIAQSILLIYAATLPAATLPATGIAAPREGDLEHVLAYLVYGVLLTLSFRRPYPALAAGIGMGLLTEALQLAVPTRSFDALDLLADTAGVLLGAAVVYKFSCQSIRMDYLDQAMEFARQHWQYLATGGGGLLGGYVFASAFGRRRTRLLGLEDKRLDVQRLEAENTGKQLDLQAREGASRLDVMRLREEHRVAQYQRETEKQERERQYALKDAERQATREREAREEAKGKEEGDRKYKGEEAERQHRYRVEELQAERETDAKRYEPFNRLLQTMLAQSDGQLGAYQAYLAASREFTSSEEYRAAVGQRQQYREELVEGLLHGLEDDDLSPASEEWDLTEEDLARIGRIVEAKHPLPTPPAPPDGLKTTLGMLLAGELERFQQSPAYLEAAQRREAYRRELVKAYLDSFDKGDGLDVTDDDYDISEGGGRPLWPPGQRPPSPPSHAAAHQRTEAPAGPGSLSNLNPINSFPV